MVLERFRRASYQVTWNIVRADEHCVPRRRPRLYLCGVLSVAEGRRFEWPQPLKVKPGLVFPRRRQGQSPQGRQAGRAQPVSRKY
eukprot:2748044-Lingulodinium_polyedra.AAC.1